MDIVTAWREAKIEAITQRDRIADMLGLVYNDIKEKCGQLIRTYSVSELIMPGSCMDYRPSQSGIYVNCPTPAAVNTELVHWPVSLKSVREWTEKAKRITPEQVYAAACTHLANEG